MTTKSNSIRAWLLMIIVITWAIHFSGSFWIGFISDDYDLLDIAPHMGVFEPYVNHHISPFMTTLFKLSAIGWFPPQAWHSLALFFHTLNILLFYRLSSRNLCADPFSALTATALVAFSAAGYEAIAWACALGYPIIMTCLLVGLLLATNLRHDHPLLLSSSLAMIQLLALFIWDWGIIVLPVCSVAAWWTIRPRTFSDWRMVILRFAPAGVVWVGVLAAKRLLGYQAGYVKSFPDVTGIASMLAGAPLTALWPNARMDFLLGAPGKVLAVAIILLLAAGALRNRNARLPLMLFLITTIPAALFSSLQSRYSYISTPYLYLALILGMRSLAPVKPLRLLVLSLLAFHASLSLGRSQLWKSAYEQSVQVRSAVDAIFASGAERLVIVNLPDSYGPPGMIWRPFVWRKGMSSFTARYERVNTPECGFIWRGAPWKIYARDEILKVFTNHAIYEVAYAETNHWRTFKVSPFTP